MLHCKMDYAAMQTKGLLLASGIPRLQSKLQRGNQLPSRRAPKMSKTTSFPVASSANLFNRMMGSLDRLLMAHARIAIRNGDLPYFGL
jgi:hypothetical protein